MGLCISKMKRSVYLVNNTTRRVFEMKIRTPVRVTTWNMFWSLPTMIDSFLSLAKLNPEIRGREFAPGERGNCVVVAEWLPGLEEYSSEKPDSLKVTSLPVQPYLDQGYEKIVLRDA